MKFGRKKNFLTINTLILGLFSSCNSDRVNNRTKNNETNSDTQSEDVATTSTDGETLLRSRTAARHSPVSVKIGSDDPLLETSPFANALFEIRCANDGIGPMSAGPTYYVANVDNCSLELESLGQKAKRVNHLALKQLTGLNQVNLFQYGKNFFTTDLNRTNEKGTSHILKINRGVRLQDKPSGFLNVPRFDLQAVDPNKFAPLRGTFQVKIVADVNAHSSIFLDLDPGANAAVQNVILLRPPTIESTSIVAGGAFNIGGLYTKAISTFEATITLKVANSAKTGDKVNVSLFRDSALESYFKNGTDRSLSSPVGFRNTQIEFTVK